VCGMTGAIVFALLLLAALVFGMAYAIGTAPIGNQDDEDLKEFERRMSADAPELEAFAAQMSKTRAMLEEQLGRPVSNLDKQQNAPTSLTLQ